MSQFQPLYQLSCTQRGTTRHQRAASLVVWVPREVPEEMMQVNKERLRQQVWQLCQCMHVCLWLSSGLLWVVQLASNWLVSPPQCVLTSINRTAEEPGWNLMPLFSLSDPLVLSAAHLHPSSFFFFLHSKSETMCHLLDLLLLPPARVSFPG